MPVVINQRNGKAVVRVTGATETVVVVGNSAVSNIAVAQTAVTPLLASESVVSADINYVYWSGTVTVARGANTVLSLSGAGAFDLAGTGMPLTEWNTANVVITASGSATCIVELSKNTNMVTEY